MLSHLLSQDREVHQMAIDNEHEFHLRAEPEPDPNPDPDLNENEDDEIENENNLAIEPNFEPQVV